MHALLLIAHGSRLAASNLEFKQMVEALPPLLIDHYDLIEPAYLELCSPSIGEAIDNLVLRGAKQLTILPYFLNQGRHVREDVPGEIDEKNQQYPDLLINSLPYFGSSKIIAKLVAQQINES